MEKEIKAEKDYKSLGLTEFSLEPIPSTCQHIPTMYEICKNLIAKHNLRPIKKDTNENREMDS